MSPTLLVVAKAPVPGLAKTRIGAEVGHELAAEVAAAALLDTLETALTVNWPVVVALTGDLSDAARSAEISAMLSEVRVVEQRGDTFADRLVQAHLDADAGHGVVQVGMDTPQVSVADYVEAGEALQRGSTALGPAGDGGWWLLGVQHGHEARVLSEVPMSRADTGDLTAQAFGGRIERLRTLTDLDTWDDAVAVAADLPGSRLARAVSGVAA